MQHTMQTMLLNGKLFWSPIGPSPQKILDLGTGTGNTARYRSRRICYANIFERNMGT